MDVKLVAAARLQIALEAAERWQSRSSAREIIEAKLRAGGTAMADTPLRVGRFLQRQQLPARGVTNVQLSRIGSERFAERMIGPTLDWDYFPPSEIARLSGVPVARIVILPQRGAAAVGFGTGFLVAPGVLLTNHHVLTSQSESRGIGAHFLFERVNPQLDSPGLFFELDPDALFITDVRLDFTLIAVKSSGVSGETIAALGMLPLVGATGKILIGQPVNIIQHPNGEVKRYATTSNQLLDLPDANFMQYETDTLPGSSGSPAFNTRWEVVGLHHSGVPAMRDGQIVAVSGLVWTDDMGEDQIKWVANEGVRVSAIVEHLRGVTLSDERQAALLRQVLEIGGADSLFPAAQPSSALLGNLEGGQVSAGSIVFNISGNTTINVTSAAPASASFGTDLASLTKAADLDAPEKRLEFDPSYADRQGYNPDFLPGFSLPLPSVAAGLSTELVSVGGQPLVLQYHHYSLVMNQARRLLVWSAVNVDYSPLRRPFKGGRKDFGSDDWRLDPRISSKFQIQDAELYKGTQFDRGHMVRRDDNAWGDTIRQQEFANADTFHYTNCTPQHKAFNQAPMQGLWGQLEEYIKTAMGAVGNRACIYAGPILSASDPAGEFGQGAIQYPLRFWKVFVAVELENNQNVLRAYGFILDQRAVIDRFGLDERLDFGALSVNQVALEQITSSTGVIFDAALLSADVMVTPNAAPAEPIKLASLEAIRLR